MDRAEELPAMARPPSAADNALFAAFRIGFGSMLRLAFRIRVDGPPPPAGAFVLAANHSSFLDPLLIGSVVPRRIVYLMTEVVWRSRGLGWFYRWSRAIPVGTRGGNREAMRAARSVLQQGRVVGIFPEGGLTRDGGMLLGNPGAVALVLQENVPIVPVGIVGAHGLLPPGAALPRFRSVRIRFGEPILPAEFDALAADRRTRLRAATTLIMQRIAALAGTVAREDALAVRR